MVKKTAKKKTNKKTAKKAVKKAPAFVFTGDPKNPGTDPHYCRIELGQRPDVRFYEFELDGAPVEVAEEDVAFFRQNNHFS